jgi:hypothetical protein
MQFRLIITGLTQSYTYDILNVKMTEMYRDGILYMCLYAHNSVVIG